MVWTRLALLLIPLSFCHVASADTPAQPLPFLDETALDRKVNPCDDFYQFACGNWIAKTEIPGDRPGWSRGFYEVAKLNEERMRGILEKYAAGQLEASDPDTRKLGDFYAMCMDEKKAETSSLRSLKSRMKEIDRVKDAKSLAREVGTLQLEGTDVFFNFGSMQDRHDSSQMIAGVDQGGLGLPDRDYYLKQEGKMPEIRKLYVEHVQKMLGLMGQSKRTSAKDAKLIMTLETQLATAALPREDLRDPKKTYNRIEMAGLKKAVPQFDWDSYFSVISYHGGDALSTSAPTFLAGLNDILKKNSLADFKVYLKWHLLDRSASALGKKFVDENFAFASKALTGQKELPPRWKRCVKATDASMGEPLGRSYVRLYFPGDSKQQAQATVGQIENAFGEDLKELNWMDDSTKKQAVEKLKKVVNQIGYPDKWRDFGGLAVTRDSYLQNLLAAAKFNNEYDLNKIGKPVDRTEWGMSPPTVNAYYDAENNKMVFPAGILQSPFFNAKAPLPVNYGGIGMVMGHELTHGFDDEGRQYDAGGNLRDWWSPKVSEEFQKRAECLVKQYAGYVPVDSLHVNGKLTLGENIADQGGIKLSYNSFMAARDGNYIPKAAGFDEKQQFFLGFAQSWCTKMRPEYARMLVTVDPHSPAKYRVNGPLSNFPGFAAAFDCKEGSPMAPKDRCEIW